MLTKQFELNKDRCKTGYTVGYPFYVKRCRHWEERHQNANGGYIWGWGLWVIVIFYFRL